MQLLDRPPTTFSYPDGAWDHDVALRVREVGYQGAVTLIPSAARSGDNVFAIPRLLAVNDPGFVRSLADHAACRRL